MAFVEYLVQVDGGRETASRNHFIPKSSTICTVHVENNHSFFTSVFQWLKFLLAL